MRTRYRLLIALIAAVALPYYWLLLDNRPGDAAPAPLPLAEARRLADAIPGPRPESVALQQVAWRRLPGTLMVAGSGLKRQLISIQAAELRGPWGSIAIDSGLGAEDAAAMGLEQFVPAHQAQVDAALRRARLIVFTHEHVDHIGGLLRLPDFATVVQKALITPEQSPAGVAARTLPWPAGSARAIRPFAYSGMRAIAPGVVLIRTPGHTPGSQMVFVRLADGREILFAGDTATMDRSWRELRARSRLVGDLLVDEDRAAVFGWLKAVRAAHRASPALLVIPGHDYEALRAPIYSGAIGWGFPANPAT